MIADLTTGSPNDGNPLLAYFNSNTEGRGIWKWRHYFDIYVRHFQRFVGREVRVLEVGVYSGGSLGMWKSYFGPECRIFGVDIEEACTVYEDERVEVFIGDQADHGFWERFKRQVPPVDIVIDDGGHHYWQQTATLEEMLPHLRPGGVYLCEDVGGDVNHFAAYAYGLASQLNAIGEPTQGIYGCKASSFQGVIHSVHLYPFAVVIEKRSYPVTQLVAPKQGSQWQPFL